MTARSTWPEILPASEFLLQKRGWFFGMSAFKEFLLPFQKNRRFFGAGCLQVRA